PWAKRCRPSGAVRSRTRVKPMFDPRTHFLPYQLAWIADDSPVAIGEKSRRIGWTYASAFRAVERRLRLGTNLYYTSADLTAAREFIDYCKFWAGVWQAHAEELPFDDNTLMLRFPHNDSAILAGSSNPKFFRSKGAVAQGLVEKIKRLSSTSEKARRDFVEELRATCPDEDAWNEEYLCRPSSEQRALLSYALIQSCEVGGEEWEKGTAGEGEKQSST